MSLTGTERTIRNHYTPVCRCVWDGNDEWPTRVEATTDCVIHGDIPDPLLALLREVGELRQRLLMIRDAWNAHMVTCPQHAALPDLPAPTWEELEAWRDAPSGTASADLIGDPNFDPKGDDELSV